MRVLVLDPGETTGYCLATVRDGVVKIEEVGTFLFPQTYEFVRSKKMPRSPDIVVIEDFVLRRNLIGRRFPEIRVIGAVEVLFGQSGAAEIVFQQPTEKQRMPDSRLKKLGYWDQSPHIRDAMRHLFIYLEKRSMLT